MSKSNAYWQKRLAQAFNTIEKDVEYLLAKGYWKALEDLLKELEKAYDIIYNETTSGEILLSHLYQYDRYYQLMNLINDKLIKLGILETSILEDAFVEMYKEVSAIISERYDLPDISNLTNDLIKLRINKVWNADGKSWSDRIWKDKDKLKNELSKALTQSLLQGKPPSAFADELGNKLDASKNRAKTLLRTELAHTLESSALLKYKDAGVKYVKIKNGDFKRRLSYISKNGAHFYDIPCEACSSLEYTIWEVNDPTIPILPAHPNADALIYL